MSLQALLLYLYTGEIEFAPFGSDGNRKLRKLENSMTDDQRTPKASPKSIYRLAEKVHKTNLLMNSATYFSRL